MKFKSFFFLFILFSCFLFNYSKAEAKRDNLLLIGDSRTYGMSLYCKNKDKHHFLAEGGVGIGFVSDKLEVKLGIVMSNAITNTLTSDKSGDTVDLKKAIKDNNIDTIVWLLGVNGMSNWSKNKDAVAKKLKKLEKTGCTVYYAYVLPIVSSKCKNIKEKDIKDNNKYWGKNYTNTIDTYTVVTKVDDWKDNTSDGLHYGAKVYDPVLSEIEKVVKTGTSGNTSNSGKFSCPNDGEKKSKDKIFEPSGIDSSFKNCKYYDCWLPYKVKCGTIGGLDAGADKSAPDQLVGHVINVEGGLQKGEAVYYKKNAKSIDENGSDNTSLGPNLNAVIKACAKVEVTKDKIVKGTTKDGVEFYFTAVQPWFFSNTANLKLLKGHASVDKKIDDYGYGVGFGMLLDVITVKGTVVHFCMIDINAEGDTNGATASLNKGYEHYKHLFAFQSGGNLEILGNDFNSATKMREKILNNEEIAFYRLYNKSITDKLETTSDEAKSASHKVTGGSSPNGDPNATPEPNANNIANNAIALNGYYSEEALSSYLKLREAYLTDMINNSSKDLLDQEDLSNLSNWKQNKESMDIGVNGVIRKIIQIIGVAIDIWAVLLYVGFWFDRVNIFLDVDLLGILSFGQLHEVDDDKDANFQLTGTAGNKTTVGRKQITLICLVMIASSTLLISGVVYRFLLTLINFIFRLVGA